jgi:hypothetical protein
MPLSVVQTPDSRASDRQQQRIVEAVVLGRRHRDMDDQEQHAARQRLERPRLAPDGTKLYPRAAGRTTSREFKYADGVVTRARTFSLPAVPSETLAGGLALSRDGNRLYVTACSRRRCRPSIS